MRIAPVFAALAAVASLPALAQGQATSTPDPAVNAANANGAAGAAIAGRPDVGVQPADQAAYDADLAAYRLQLRAHYDGQDYDAAVAARNERAYAEAMHAWRLQTIACKRGRERACRAPTPRPADYF